MRTDRWIVKEIKKENEKAIHELIDKYGTLFLSIIRKHSLGYTDFHEECLNDVLLAIWENIDSFDQERGSFKDWACAIARYKALDLIKANKKHMNYSEIEDKQIIDIKSYSEDSLVLKEELDSFLSCLNEEDRTIFLKLFYEGLSVEELAEENKISQDAIYQRISRGRKKMRRQGYNEG